MLAIQHQVVTFKQQNIRSMEMHVTDSSTIVLHFTAFPLLLLFLLQQCPEALR